MTKGLVFLPLVLAACSIDIHANLPPPPRANANAAAYGLDGRDRRGCTPDELVTYRGTAIHYSAPVRVHPSFVSHLEELERIARDVGVEVYGRPPTALHHGGAYACRKMASGRFSEHAFGNALDLEGFSFDKERIHVTDAWRDDDSPKTAQARRFFALFLERVDARDDVMRAIIGPPDPSHREHLHFDMGPWTYSRYEKPRATG